MRRQTVQMLAQHCTSINVTHRDDPVPLQWDAVRPVDMKRWPGAGFMLGHRLRRWPNMKPAPGLVPSPGRTGPPPPGEWPVCHPGPSRPHEASASSSVRGAHVRPAT